MFASSHVTVVSPFPCLQSNSRFHGEQTALQLIITPILIMVNDIPQSGLKVRDCEANFLVKLLLRRDVARPKWVEGRHCIGDILAGFDQQPRARTAPNEAVAAPAAAEVALGARGWWGRKAGA
jgi:hypothetical protein